MNCHDPRPEELDKILARDFPERGLKIFVDAFKPFQQLASLGARHKQNRFVQEKTTICEIQKGVGELIRFLDISRRGLALEIGVSPSAISDMMRKQSRGLSTIYLQKLYEKYNVNIHWLVTGEGAMLYSGSPNAVEPMEKDIIARLRKQPHLKPKIQKLLKSDPDRFYCKSGAAVLVYWGGTYCIFKAVFLVSNLESVYC